MIKLAIFGDSFGDDTGLWGSGKFENVGPSWIDYIRSTDKYEVTNFAYGGSNLYYSKKFFDQHYEKFDEIVFLITHPLGRLEFKKFEKELINLPKQFFNINTVLSLEKESYTFTEFENSLLNAVKDYYIYVQNDEFDLAVHHAMLDDIKVKFPKVILIPCFHDSFLDNKVGLIDIAQKEQKFFGLGDGIPNSKNFADARKCHLCEENHLILGKKILEFLQGNPVVLNIHDFVNPTKNKEHYFRKKIWIK